MATNKNITMKQFNGTDYDTLYPKTIASQVSGIFSKEEIVSTETLSKYGLGADAVPDDAFKLISGLGNWYVWSKSRTKCIPTGNVIDNIYVSVSVSGYFIEYSNTCDIVDGSVVLTGNITRIDTASGVPSTTDLNVLAGKYFVTNINRNLDSSATTKYTNIVLYGDKNGTQFNGSGNYAFLRGFPFYTVEPQKVIYGYVNSPDPNAYPPAVSDGYTYTALGQLGNKVQIATGSYVGTGTYGSSNPNSLTFDFEPKLIMVSGTDANIYHRLIIPFMGYGFSFITNLTSNTTMSACGVATMFSGNTVSWYNTSGAGYQFNNELKYNYCAIG